MKGLYWRVYRRVRIGFAIMGFIIMYSMSTGLFNIGIFTAALSVFFGELFGALYNDYCDIEEDKKNKRNDKLTVSKTMDLDQTKRLAVLMASFCIITAIISSFLVFAIIYIIMAWAYSNPKIRLKSYNIKGYFALSLSWFFIPIYLGFVYRDGILVIDVLLGSFFFFQYLYLLCQKDSTDLRDRTNLFVEKGWRLATTTCSILAFLSSMSLLFISMSNILLVILWALNASVKSFQLKSMFQRTMTRNKRSKLVLMEFLTPYLYAGGALIV